MPEEPIGVGAVWVVSRTHDDHGVEVKEQVTYELSAAEGDRLTLAVSSLIRAEPQDIARPPSKKNQQTGKAQGQIQVRLTQPAPHAGWVEQSVARSREMERGGSSFKQTMQTDVRLDVAQKAVPTGSECMIETQPGKWAPCLKARQMIQLPR